MNFSERIRQMRESRGLNHSQLATVFGKTEGAIRSWEAGRTKPDVDTLIKLVDYFECTTDYLLGMSDEKNPKQAKHINEFAGEMYNKINSIPEKYKDDAINTIGFFLDLFNVEYLPDSEREGFFKLVADFIDWIKVLSTELIILELTLELKEENFSNDLKRRYVEILEDKKDIKRFVEMRIEELTRSPLKRINDIINVYDSDREVAVYDTLDRLEKLKEEAAYNAETQE